MIIYDCPEIVEILSLEETRAISGNLIFMGVYENLIEETHLQGGTKENNEQMIWQACAVKHKLEIFYMIVPFHTCFSVWIRHLHWKLILSQLTSHLKSRIDDFILDFTDPISTQHQNIARTKKPTRGY